MTHAPGMRIALPAIIACYLVSCGPKPEADGALEAASLKPGPAMPCTGSPLPVTGVCSDANPALFVSTDNSLETFARGCVWRTQELQIAAKEALVFRAQDCTGEMWDKTVYIWVDRYVKSYTATVPADQADFALEVFDVADGQTAEQVALQTLATAPEDQRDRCITKSTSGKKVSGKTFDLGPNDDLAREMQQIHQDETWEACGPNGFTNDSIQFWEDRKTHALFHILGQDQPGWDPASFTFYSKNPDGTWTKTG